MRPLRLLLAAFSVCLHRSDAQKGDAKPVSSEIGAHQDYDESAYLPFTDCDHVFDATVRRGHFSLPVFPREANSDISAAAAPGDNDQQLLFEQNEAEEDEEARSTWHPFVTVQSGEGEGNDKGGDGVVRYKSLPANIQCIYTFVAGPQERVKLEFDHFQLEGTVNHCENEYLDVYSELESPTEDLLSANLGARYCGTVAPNVRISLHNVVVLILHSLVGRRRSEHFVLGGRFEYIAESPFLPGPPLAGVPRGGCAFLVEPSHRRNGSILSPTYPGTYPSNFHCVYLLRGSPGDRIRLFFRDFDVYFGGEHCPYDSVTIYDGPSTSSHILRKLCGLQQRTELFSFGPELLIEFNTTDPPKSDLRGFVIEYEFSDRFVDVRQLIDTRKSISHIRGTECDIRVCSGQESVHRIHSPNFPHMHPPNTTCMYILDGLKGDQKLEKVILTFETFALPSSTATSIAANSAEKSTAFRPVSPDSSHQQHSPMGAVPEDCANSSFVGIGTTANSIKAILDNSEESTYDMALCGRVLSPGLRSYESQGPRIVLILNTVEGGERALDNPQLGPPPYGFSAKVEFKTDFGIAGEAIGDSNRCAFRFRDESGSFNSPRYPANYPLDTECHYHIVGTPGKQILLYFKQFAMFEEKDKCNDWLQIFDVFHDANGAETLKLQAKHCWHVFPGPTVSAFGSHEMRVVFHADDIGAANGFDAHYEIFPAFREEVPAKKGVDPRHCGERIEANDQHTTGQFESPGFPVKYGKGLLCDWEIRVRPGHQVLLKPNVFNVEGQMTDEKVDCMSAVLRVHLDMNNRSGSDLQLCGESVNLILPIVTASNSIRLSFLTSPEKVNGLNGFNFSWTEVRRVQNDGECADEKHYLCSYSRLCIDAKLRCNGDDNCGENDDSDEAHCSRIEGVSDMRTIIVAYIVSGVIFAFIVSFFCVLFKSKLERKKAIEERRNRLKKRQKGSQQQRKGDGSGRGGQAQPRQRQPYRQPRPRRMVADGHRLSGAIGPGGTSLLGGGLPPPMRLVLEESEEQDEAGGGEGPSTAVPPQHLVLPPFYDDHSQTSPSSGEATTTVIATATVEDTGTEEEENDEDEEAERVFYG